jgi:hypothetical protein
MLYAASIKALQALLRLYEAYIQAVLRLDWLGSIKALLRLY